MNVDELVEYFWDLYNNGLTDEDEFVRRVNQDTTFHDERVIRAFYRAINNLFMGDEE